MLAEGVLDGYHLITIGVDSGLGVPAYLDHPHRRIRHAHSERLHRPKRVATVHGAVKLSIGPTLASYVAMPLPPELLLAATEGHGRIVFVMGAGCSVEPPTSLPLARACSRQAHQRLVNDGVISDGECTEPENLEALADAVVAKTRSKAPLVSRLPRQQFQFASPNRGHDVLAALMAEGVVRAAMTTNFDLAINAALTNVGVHDVTTIDGPDDHRDLGSASVIYLHRSVNAPDEEWVLTTAEVNEAWDNRWNVMLARTVLAAPAVVFIGLGTPVGVLLASIEQIRAAIPNRDSVFQVDPHDPEDSGAFELLRPKAENYVQAGWISFAMQLADRVNRHHINQLENACDTLVRENGWSDIDVQPVMACLATAGLLTFGSCRARWFLADGKYLAWRHVYSTWVAELVIALERSRHELTADITLSRDGTVRFSKNGRRIGSLGYVHGRASKRWSRLVSECLHRREYMDGQQGSAEAFAVAGVEGPLPDQFSTPTNIVDESEEFDIVAPTANPAWFTTDQLRQEPHLLSEVFNT